MIEISHLSKRYGQLLAVDDISFRVEPGQVLGFLGPNGAGKSTTMKMIAGFLAPSAGTISVAGHDIQAEPLAAKRLIGYLPEGAPAWGEMTPRQFLGFIADIRGLDGALRARRIAEVVERLNLQRVLDQSIETLSKGFKRRVGLAQAILHDPQVLILDEPTDGLDPNQKHEVRSLIQAMAKDKIIVISTHILEEVHAVCTRAIVIAGGRLLADATPAELERRSRFHGAVSLSCADTPALVAALRALDEVAQVEVDPQDGRVTAFPKAGKPLFPAVSALIRDRGFAVDELALESGRLDEVFRQITLPVHKEGVRR